MTMKAWTEPMKAEPLTTSQLDLWLQGKRSRRVLVLPFTGPLPGGKAGLDLDGEYFDDATDTVGDFPQLRRTRERLVDWHHDVDPTGVMKGAILGRITLDGEPEQDGLWAEFWANAGERRRALMAQLEAQGVPLYGSSQTPGAHSVRKASDGHIEVWPIIRHTITTSPQNTHAVVPALKALLDEGAWMGDVSIAAYAAAMLESGGSPLRTLSTLAGQPGEQTGERVGKADSLSVSQANALEAALQQLGDVLQLR